jgi:hypothetical protein
VAETAAACMPSTAAPQAATASSGADARQTESAAAAASAHRAAAAGASTEKRTCAWHRARVRDQVWCVRCAGGATAFGGSRRGCSSTHRSSLQGQARLARHGGNDQHVHERAALQPHYGAGRARGREGAGRQPPRRREPGRTPRQRRCGRSSLAPAHQPAQHEGRWRAYSPGATNSTAPIC